VGGDAGVVMVLVMASVAAFAVAPIATMSARLADCGVPAT
jgi:hypothetical protein